MSGTEYFAGRRYDVVAFAHGERTVYYEQFGDEDEGGEWLLVGQGADGFSVDRGKMGYRCGYCGKNEDAFSREFEQDGHEFAARRLPVTREQALAFVGRHNLQPFVAIPTETMRRLCDERTLIEVLPAHFRRLRPETTSVAEQAASTIITAVKLEMGWPVAVEDVLGVDNQELRSRALDAFGREELVLEAGAEIVDRGPRSETGSQEGRFRASPAASAFEPCRLSPIRSQRGSINRHPRARLSLRTRSAVSRRITSTPSAPSSAASSSMAPRRCPVSRSASRSPTSTRRRTATSSAPCSRWAPPASRSRSSR